MGPLDALSGSAFVVQMRISTVALAAVTIASKLTAHSAFLMIAISH
jgi:hypothetical protein